MLIHSNAKINISRMVETAWVSILSSVKTGYGVYINPRSDSIIESRDGEGSYREFMMLTDWVFPLLTGDKVFWGARTFKVQAGEELNDMTGKHGQYIIMEIHDV